MKDKLRFPGAVLFAAVLAAGVLAPVNGRGADVGPVLTEQASADRAAAESQARIDQLQDSIQEMLAKYRQALADTASINAYNQQIEQQVESQTDSITDMRGQLAEIENTQRDVLPLMQSMLDTLEQFVELDVPFLVEERAKRVEGLEEMMARADVSISEKYRRILEAYQIEMDYGRTIEAYEGKLARGRHAHRAVPARRPRALSVPDARRRGDRLLGRERARRGSWTTPTPTTFKEALRVAKKQGAPEMLMRAGAGAEGGASREALGDRRPSARCWRLVAGLSRCGVAAQSLEELLEQTQNARAKEQRHAARERNSSPTATSRRSCSPTRRRSATRPRRAAKSSRRASTPTRSRSPSSTTQVTSARQPGRAVRRRAPGGRRHCRRSSSR